MTEVIRNMKYRANQADNDILADRKAAVKYGYGASGEGSSAATISAAIRKLTCATAAKRRLFLLAVTDPRK